MHIYLYLLGLLFTPFITAGQSLNPLMDQEIQQLSLPQAPADFDPVFHFPPYNQDTTSSCWSFATVSFLESEMQRLGLEPVRLSVIFAVYYGFLEKAEYFIEKKGRSRFAAGDLFSGVLDIIRKYGIVPEYVYRGQTDDCPTHNHEKLYAELQNLMDETKEAALWDTTIILPKVRHILDTHLGRPPDQFIYKGKSYSANSFLKEVVKLPWEDYLTITSFMYAPFNESIILDVPDNWKRQNHYLNLPLPVFYDALINALKKEFSVAIDADISETGRYTERDLSYTPSFDISIKNINQASREFRFKNGSTTDDHLMHIVGYSSLDNSDWFLLKDSWRTAWDGQHKGYLFADEGYIKLKVLAYLVHRDGIGEYIENIPK